MLNNAKGIVAPALLLVLAAAGLVSYLVVSSSIPLKNELLSRLYPKPPAQAEGNWFPCGRPNQVQIGQENPGYTCNTDGNGCVKTPYARYQNTTDQNGDGVADPNNPGDQPWCDNNCQDPVKYCNPGSEPPPPTTSCSSPVPACTDCIIKNRSDILPFYGSNGWDIDCTNWVNIVNNWCNIDPSGCYNISTTTCASSCGYSAPPSTDCTDPTGAEGSWRYVCTTNTCSTDSNAGVGIPYQCQSGQWVNKNPSGECTNQCQPSGGGGTTPAPTPAPTATNSFNLSGNCNSGAGLSASWVTGSTGTNCNAHIYAGSTAYKVSGNCTGTWTGNTLGSGGPAIVNGGTYKLCVNNPGGNQIGCSGNVTTTCSGTATPTPSSPSGNCGTPEFLYNQCTGCQLSEPVYRDACGNWSTGAKQTDPECGGTWCESTNTCQPQTCTFSQTDKKCASGVTICSGSGTTGFNTAGCTYKNNCSSCECYVPDPTPAPTSKPTSTPIPVEGSSNNCAGKYNYNNPKPYMMCSPFGNFGDGGCDYVNGSSNGKDQLFSILNSDPRLAGKTTTYDGKVYSDVDIWFNYVIAHESGFSPNAVSSWVTNCGAENMKGAFGFAQMGGTIPQKNGTINTSNGNKYDWGNVNWRQQIDNALNYQVSLGSCRKWNYWGTVPQFWNICK